MTITIHRSHDEITLANGETFYAEFDFTVEVVGGYPLITKVQVVAFWNDEVDGDDLAAADRDRLAKAISEQITATKHYDQDSVETQAMEIYHGVASY